MRYKLFMFLLGFASFGFAQQPSIEVNNLFANPTFDQGFDRDTVIAMDSTVFLEVAFSVDNLADADKIYLSIGSFEGDSSTFHQEFIVVNSQGIYYLDDGNVQKQFYSSFVSMSFNIYYEALQNYQYYEVWGIDKNGIITPKYKFHL